MKRIILLTLIISLSLTSCRKNCREKDDKLTFEKSAYEGNLRTNGCYYHYHSEYYTPAFSIVFLYKNGVVLTEYTEDIDDYERYATGSRHGQKYDWGVFKVENGRVRIETWSPGKCAYPVYVNTGIVLNDTTIVLEEKYRAINTEDYTKSADTFYFRQTPTKPDSTQPYL